MTKHTIALAATALLVSSGLARDALGRDKPELVFCDFEDPNDINLWEKGDSGAREISVGPRTRTDFNNCLKMVAKSGPWPGIVAYPPKIPKDWSKYEVLSFLVWSPVNRGVAVRIDDEKSFNYATRFNGGADLMKGRTLVQIPIAKIAESIDVKRIKALIIFMGQPPKGLTLWFDDFRLGPRQTAKVDFIPYEKRYDTISSLEQVSPHFPLARPLAGGPVRAFMLTSTRYGREVTEMMQRMDLKVSQLTWDREWGPNTWGLGDYYGRRGHGTDNSLMQKYLDSTMQGPEKFDVMALYTPYGWKGYTESARKKIVERVRDRGEGLVLVMPFTGEKQSNAWPADLRGLSALVDSYSDWMRPGGSIKWANNGRIHGKAWKKTGRHPITDGVPLEGLPFGIIEVQDFKPAPGAQVIVALESGQPVIAVRTVGKGRVVTIATRALSLSPHISPPEDYPNQIPHRFWEVWYSLMDRCLLWAAGREFERAGSPTTLAASGMHADAALAARQWKNARGEVTDWEMTYTPPGRGVARIEVSAPELVRPGDDVTISFAVPGAVADATWTATLSERIGVRWRTLERAVVRTANARGTCALSTERLGQYVAYVLVEAKKGGEVVARGKAETFVPAEPVWDDYQVHTWLESGLPFLQQFEEQRMREFGLTANTSGPGDVNGHKRMLRAGIRVHGCGFTGGLHTKAIAGDERGYAATKDKKYLVRKPSYADPAYVASEKKKVREASERLAPYKPLSAILADETSLTTYTKDFDYDFHPRNVDAFRVALEKKFGTVAALNKALGSSVASFDSITPPTTDEARASKSWSLWNEWRSHNDDMWTGVFRMYGETIKSVIPNARVSVSGSQTSAVFNGIDWAKLTPQLGAISGYGGRFQELKRLSFFPGDQKVTPWGGYGRRGRSVDHQLWDSLTTGGDGMGLFWWYSLRDPDLTFCASGADYHRVIAEFRRGIAKQMMRSMRRFSPVAILWSPVSQRAAWAAGKFEEFTKTENDVVVTLRTAEFDPYFVSEADAASGGLEKRGVKVVVLPMTLALGEGRGPGGVDVTSALSKLLAGGGSVVATHDVTSNEFLRPAAASVSVQREFKRFADMKADLARAFTALGVRPQVTVRARAGGAVKGLSSTVHRCPGGPDAFIITLLRRPVGFKEVVGADGVIRSEPDDSSGAKVEACTVDVSSFDGCRFVDIRSGEPLTPTDGKLALDLHAGDGWPIAVLPYAPPRFSAEVKRDDRTLSVSWRLKSDAKPMAEHVVRVDVVDGATGKADDVLCHNVACAASGKGRIDVPLAEEDAGRTLTFRLHDVLGGATWVEGETANAPDAPSTGTTRSAATNGTGTDESGEAKSAPDAGTSKRGTRRDDETETDEGMGSLPIVAVVAIVLAIAGAALVMRRSKPTRRRGRTKTPTGTKRRNK